MLTRYGVAYDLTNTPYQVYVMYDDLKVCYNFSSKLNKQRFINKAGKNRENINSSLSKRFNITIIYDLLCDIKLYSTVEKRGFLIETESDSYTCLNTIKLNGKNQIIKS